METSRLTAERIREYLDQGKRFDGRKPEDFREITIEGNVSNKAEGSARVKLGKTEVIVGVKMGVACTLPRFTEQRKFNGYFRIASFEFTKI